MSNSDIAFHIEVVTALREALHPNTDLLIDAHWAYAPHDILKVAYALEALNLMWLEDPIPAENVAALKEVKNATRTPICTGENLYTRHGFRELVETQATDIISPIWPRPAACPRGGASPIWPTFITSRFRRTTSVARLALWP